MPYLCCAISLVFSVFLIFLVRRDCIRRQEERSSVYNRMINALTKRISSVHKETKEKVDALELRVEQLESGACADYEQAKKAAEAMNDFNEGISNILNFDPAFYLKERRDGGGSQ